MSSLPLSGRRILVTRSMSQTAKLSDGLRVLGATPVEVPVLEIIPPESYAPLDDALQNLDRYDWLILTSTNTLRAISVRCQHYGVNPANAYGLNVAAIGRATSEAAQSCGFHVAVVPEAQVSESLVSSLGERVRGKRVLLPQASITREIIADALTAAGAVVDVVEAYRNVLPEAAVAQLQEAMAGGIDAATFTSSSSVTHLQEVARRTAIPFPLVGVQAVSIGPITSQTLRAVGWEPAAEANPSDIPGLIAALAILMNRNS